MLRPTLSRAIYLIVWRAKREHGFFVTLSPGPAPLPLLDRGQAS
jgi:hypothetical protein